jgi:hypothetical protein
VMNAVSMKHSLRRVRIVGATTWMRLRIGAIRRGESSAQRKARAGAAAAVEGVTKRGSPTRVIPCMHPNILQDVPLYAPSRNRTYNLMIKRLTLAFWPTLGQVVQVQFS